MRITAILLGGLALLAIAGGIFVYWLGSTFICVDVCPPISSANQQLPVLVAVTLGPGLLLSLAAWILSLLYTRSQNRPRFFIAIILTPVAAALAVALILYITSGSFTPIAVSGPPEVAPASRQISSDWLNATRYAVIPLIIWPLVSFIAALPRPANRQG